MKVFISSLVIFLGVAIGQYIFGNPYIALAIGVGLYMAINIGANDVANNVGPAVGARAITLKQAIIIAAIGEFSGAVIAGGDVVKTIKKGIVDVSSIQTVSGSQAGEIFVLIMLSALLAGAIWLTLATYFKAPVSTTHSIVGGVMGSGIAALGFGAVSWGTMGTIAASWVISPILGGIIAALFLYGIKKTIIFKQDKISAAKQWVPFFVAIMSWSFITYIILKGIKQVIQVNFSTALLLGFIGAVITFFCVRLILAKKRTLINTREGVVSLFTIPLIFSVALLSFAHGANDVANAIGPMAAIYDTVMSGDISTKVNLPLWILALGGFGIAFGLSFFGPRIIKTVGSEITELDSVRAFSIALAASITVIIASQLGLPVSSTHIAIGGVFGVGLLREWLERNGKTNREHYVKRELVHKIVASWIITVPAAAVLSALLFIVMKYFML